MISIDRATTYTILPGQSNFRPLENPAPRFCSSFEVAFRFAPSCWWPETPDNRVQRERWMKLKGFTHFFGRNNYRTVLIAFRPGKLEGVMEVIAYTNDKRGNWKTTGKPVEVHVGEVVYASCQVAGKTAKYEISYFGNITKYEHPWDSHWIRIYREVGTWINEPGAVQPMEIEIAFELT